MNERWSYKVVEFQPTLFGNKLGELAQQELDKLGQQGWELVSTLQASELDVLRLFLKRAQ